jgi:hypothetical protein
MIIAFDTGGKEECFIRDCHEHLKEGDHFED